MPLNLPQKKHLQKTELYDIIYVLQLNKPTVQVPEKPENREGR